MLFFLCILKIPQFYFITSYFSLIKYTRINCEDVDATQTISLCWCYTNYFIIFFISSCKSLMIIYSIIGNDLFLCICFIIILSRINKIVLRATKEIDTLSKSKFMRSAWKKISSITCNQIFIFVKLLFLYLN